jgi:hypothetical protein
MASDELAPIKSVHRKIPAGLDSGCSSSWKKPRRTNPAGPSVI